MKTIVKYKVSPGGERWYQNNDRHRNIKPAAIWANGKLCWYRYDFLIKLETK